MFDFMQHVYGVFGLDFKLKLSTRPDNFLGEVETWNAAEKVRALSSHDDLSRLTLNLCTQQLTEALDKHFPGQWELNPGDGAFYGPKIDITLRDALKRSFQCATLQLDFQLPERFNLKYRGPEDPATAAADRPPSRPVIIHRAILGSVERFISVITEHFAGKW